MLPPLLVTICALSLIVALRNRLAPGAAVFGAVLILLVTRVISAQEAFAGFSNPAVATVAALYVLARAVQRTDVLGPALRAVMGRTTGSSSALLRLLLASAGCSAFVNNTPIVAMLAPAVSQYADDRKQPPSRFLLPMVYAVSLGGTLTLIGTSTNLVVSGLMTRAHLAPLGMFELSPLGLGVAILGIAVLLATSPWALRDRRSARAALRASERDFAVHMTIVPAGPLDGRTVDAAGLRHLKGVFLVEVDRAGTIISPVTPSTTLAGGDHLTFVGRADDILDLEKIKGLSSSEATHLSSFDPSRHAFFEAVIGAGSPLTGKTLKEIGFRARYQGAVVAIHRDGERLRDKLGTVRLRPGDALLFIADPGFRRSDFLLVNRVGGAEHSHRRRGRWVGLVLLAVVVIAGLQLAPLLETALVAAALVVVAGLVTPTEVREAIDLDVLCVVAGSFALGAAVETSGLSQILGHAIASASLPLGPRGALLLLTVTSIGLSQIVTCNTAAAISVPLALSVARQLGIDPRPLLIAITIGASSTYLTPLGYQTKMMVYGPGGYRFGDYFRLGLPLVTAVVALVVVAVPWLWRF